MGNHAILGISVDSENISNISATIKKKDVIQKQAMALVPAKATQFLANSLLINNLNIFFCFHCLLLEYNIL